MIKVGVIGASGFTGEELVSLLLSHPGVKLTYVSAQLEKGQKLSKLFPRFKGRTELFCDNLDLQRALQQTDLVFLALPHTVSIKIAPFFIKKGKTVIDLSADYRLKDARVYKKYYKSNHSDAINLKKAVYGLPEFYEKEIAKGTLIANPGCYPTVSILSLAPLAKEGLIENVVIDAKSGVTGAGRKANLAFHYAHLQGNLFCYKPFGHQHLPEITQVLSAIVKKKVLLRFTPHLVPLERGILMTAYGRLTKKFTHTQVMALYRQYYGDKPFVRIYSDGLPQLKDVVGTNFCDIGCVVDGREIVVVGVIDNLLKGASGQAVQNMNILLGLSQDAGLF